MAKIPTTNITWDIIRDTLNAAGGSVTNEIKTGFVETAKVNWRSRYKPVPYNKDFPTESDNWWKAYIVGDTYNSGRCGVDYPVYTSTASLVGVANPSTLWKHKFPTGGESQPYRITDFAGYDPNARALIANSQKNPSGDILINSAPQQGNVNVTFNNNLNTSALDYTEIGYRSSYASMLPNFYLGLIVIKDSGNAHGVVSLPYTMAELEAVDEDIYYSMDEHYAFIPISTASFYGQGSYKMYPVLFEYEQPARFNEGAFTVGGVYIPLPTAPSAVNVKALQDIYYGRIRGVSYNSQYSTLTVTIAVTNDSMGPLVLTPSGNKLRITIRTYSRSDITVEFKTNTIDVSETFEIPAATTTTIKAVVSYFPWTGPFGEQPSGLEGSRISVTAAMIWLASGASVNLGAVGDAIWFDTNGNVVEE